MLHKLALIALPEVVALCFLITYSWIDLQSTATLLVFNALFITIFTQLNGTPTIKLALLTLGNTVGTVWSYFFHMLISDAVTSLAVSNATLSIFYTVAYPVMNSLWVIAFWSLSLAALRFPTLRRNF